MHKACKLQAMWMDEYQIILLNLFSYFSEIPKIAWQWSFVMPAVCVSVFNTIKYVWSTCLTDYTLERVISIGNRQKESFMKKYRIWRKSHAYQIDVQNVSIAASYLPYPTEPKSGCESHTLNQLNLFECKKVVSI